MRYFSLFVLVFFATLFNGHSQQVSSKLTVEGVRITITQNNTLYVKGNVHVKENNQNKDNIHNEGNLIITDTLFSDVDSLFFSSSIKILSEESSDKKAYGVVTFKGPGPKHISGDSTFFADLRVEDSTLTLDTNIYVFGSISLNHDNQSNIYLNGNDIQLYNLDTSINMNTGIIDSSKQSARAEKSNSRIYDDSTGLIKAYKNNQAMPANLGFFINDNTYGDIFVHRFHTPEKNVTNGSMAEGYIIKEAPDTFNTNIGSSTRMEIHYLDSNLTSRMLEDTAELGIFQKFFSDNNNLTSYKYIEGNHDSINKIISANGDFEAGRYTIAETNCDNPPSINLPIDTTVCFNNVNRTFSCSPSINNDNIAAYNWQYTWNGDTLQKHEEIFELPKSKLKTKIGEVIKVNLKVTDSRGCVSRDTMNITVRSAPELDIDYSPPEPCAHDTISFYDSSGVKGSMYWEMTDGSETTSTENTLKIAFDHSFAQNSGDVPIMTITKENQYGCATDTSVSSLKVFPVPDVDFEPENPICAGTPFTLKNNTTLEDSAIDNAPVNTFTWSIDDNANITVTDSNHFAEGNVKWYQTDSIKDSNKNPDLQYLPSNTGDLNINLYAKTSTGCISDTTITVSIHDSVDASIETLSSEPYCSGDTIKFKAGSESSESDKVDEYKWIFPDDTISKELKEDIVNYIPSKTDTINVKLVVIGKKDCKDTSETQITVHQIPEADFSVKGSVCHGDKSLFEVTDINTSDSLTWEMADSTFSTTPNEKVKYAFNGTGEQEVKLTVTNEHGCKIVRKDTAFIGPIPEASFKTIDNCLNAQKPDTIILNTSTNEEISEYAVNTNYSWDFGDAKESSQKQPIKQYDNPGEYNISLTSVTQYKYEDKLSCENTANDSIKIHHVAQANIAAESDLCQNEAINLSAGKNHPDSIDHYKWNLGDSIINDYTDNSIDYNFSESGESKISLTAITNNECKDTATKTLTIHPSPLASFESDSVCFNEMIELEANTDSNSGDYNYEWNINDGSKILTNPTISYNPTKSGRQKVVLSVKSDRGCEATDTGHIIVHKLPENNLTNGLSDTLSRCNDEVTLNAYSDDCLYSWSNGSTSSETTVKQDGKYSVTVTDSLTGCSNSSSIYVDLNSKPKIDLPVDTTVCGDIKLDAGYFGENVNYSWNTGETTRTLTVEESGSYSVLVSSANCSASAKTQVTVHQEPEPDFSSTYFETCVSDSLRINAKIPEGNSYQWTNLNNGNTFTGEEGVFSSNTSGTEQYRIKIATVNNCSASEKITLKFRGKPDVELGADTTTCQNNHLLLDATTPTATSYKWSNGETRSYISPNVSSNVKKTKSYTVQVENEYGCKASDSVNVTYYPVPEIILPEQITSCKNESVTLNASTPFATEYKWNTGKSDSLIHITADDINIGNSAPFYVTATSKHNCSATSNKARVEFTDVPASVLPDSVEGCNKVRLNAGNYGANFNWSNGSRDQKITVYETGRYTVNIQNGNECAISDTIHATVKHVTKPYLGSDIPICKNEEKILRTGIHDDKYTFEWNGYSTGDTMLIANAGTYWVKATHENGCTAGDTIQVTEKASPGVDLGPDTYMCNEDNIILDAGADGLFYEWGSNEDTSAYSRTLAVSDTGRYWVSVKSEDGCVTRDTINIKHTNHSIEADFITHSKLISGDSVKFVDMSHPEPTKWEWEFGDYTSSILQNPVHVYYGKGRYRVVQHVSNGYCSATQAKIIKVKQAEKFADSTETRKEITDGKYIDIANVSVYPNPNKGRFTIKGNLTIRGDLNIYVFDIMGKLITIKKLDDVKSFNRRIHIENLPDGIYIVKLLTGINHKTYKIIKQ